MSNSVEKTEEILDVLSKTDDMDNAYRLYKKINKFLDENKDLKNNDDLKYRRLERCMLKAKFLSLNYFDDWTEVIDLIKNNFVLVFSLPEYNFWSKLKNNLLYLENIEERDEKKEKLKEALFKCSNKIVNSKEYNVEVIEKVSHWMKNFVSNFGPDKIDKVKKTEYLNNNKEIKKLNSRDREKIFALLNFYEILLFSSFEQEGMEETVFVMQDGKKYMLDRRGLEDLSGIERKLGSSIASENDGEEEYEENEEDDVVLDSTNMSESIKELQKKALEYNINSLEFKVLQEEINNLRDKE